MKLDSDARKWYLLKISIIDDVDPYTLKGSEFSEYVSILPSLRLDHR